MFCPASNPSRPESWGHVWVGGGTQVALGLGTCGAAKPSPCKGPVSWNGRLRGTGYPAAHLPWDAPALPCSPFSARCAHGEHTQASWLIQRPVYNRERVLFVFFKKNDQGWGNMLSLVPKSGWCFRVLEPFLQYSPNDFSNVLFSGVSAGHPHVVHGGGGSHPPPPGHCLNLTLG